MTEDYSILISKACGGDRLAAHALLERLRPGIYRLAACSLRNADDAQDVTQTTLVDILARLADVGEPAALDGFVRRAALHRCIDFKRRRATRQLADQPWYSLDAEAEEQDVLARITLRQALGRLTERERETFLLDAVDGFRHAEIAAELGISVPTVRSHLQTARRRLKSNLRAFQATPNMQLDSTMQTLIERAYPGAHVLDVQATPETWMPFLYRARIALVDGSERSVDLRDDIDPARARLLPALTTAGIPGPRLLTDPVPVDGGYRTLCETPVGENVILWTMDGTYHRFRTAADLAFGAIERLQAFTPVAERMKVPRVTLADTVARLQAYDGPWRGQTFFGKSLDTLAEVARDAGRPLRYTNYLHFYPNWYRIKERAPRPNVTDDLRFEDLPGLGRLSECINPFGHLGDPLLGLAMVWIHDCYPFVHTGFVEQYLVRHDVGRRDFAVRLGVQALATMVRELPPERPAEGAGYWDAVRGLADQALGWV